ncbi:uncharacterized protein LOC106640020 [Copidosoma floridanum]|uniref:uncharacterized protein LOC106640020 n=1 Tax=Copidosoma floridanum TaxID=29053 RepID=UPI0006C94F90|nr:uncharacterized protein LOC106640020 [Copidosoma floridanum]
MVSKRIKYARAHLSRRRHTAILSRPLLRRIQKTDFNSLSRPFSVSRAALKARATKRTKMMAQPKRIMPRYESHGQTALLHARMYVSSAGNRNLLANISGRLQAIRKSRYQKYRVISNSLAQRAAARELKIRKKLHQVLSKPADWERHYKVLARLAAPKSTHRPPKPKKHRASAKGGKAGIRRLFDPKRTNMLAQPMTKHQDHGRDPFSVARSALSYKITEHVVKLATVEPKQPPRYLQPGAVRPGALQYVASDRIVVLAKPAERQPGLETNLKENAFSVLPRALKAICRPRVKVLANPKHRVRRS